MRIAEFDPKGYIYYYHSSCRKDHTMDFMDFRWGIRCPKHNIEYLISNTKYPLPNTKLENGTPLEYNKNVGLRPLPGDHPFSC